MDAQLQTRRAALNVRLSTALLQQLEAYRESERAQRGSEAKPLPYITVLLTAVSATRDRLPALIAEDKTARAARRANTTTSPATGQFLLGDRQHTNTIYDEPTETRIWRTYQTNVQQLNTLVDDTGAEDRNQLLIVALRAFLSNQQH